MFVCMFSFHSNTVHPIALKIGMYIYIFSWRICFRHPFRVRYPQNGPMLESHHYTKKGTEKMSKL